MERLRDRLMELQETTLDESVVDMPHPYPTEKQFFKAEAGRILDRNAPFHQSSGTMNVRRRVPMAARSAYLRSYYHSAVNMPTWRILFIIFSLYLTTILVYAGFYYSLGGHCDLNMTFLRCMYLSVETMATIGEC